MKETKEWAAAGGGRAAAAAAGRVAGRGEEGWLAQLRVCCEFNRSFLLCGRGHAGVKSSLHLLFPGELPTFPSGWIESYSSLMYATTFISACIVGAPRKINIEAVQ